METKCVYIEEAKINEKIIQIAGDYIKEGELVAFPTETVYGLGGDALNENSARKIYEAKGRPSDNPLIIHISKWEDIYVICSEVDEKVEKLAKAFWPGPLTMVLPKSEIVPSATTGGLDTVAVRMPSHRVARALIDASTGFIAAPSANTSGRPSPTLAKYVYEDMKGKIPMIIDSGEIEIGVESTIVDLTSKVPTILRPGFITLEMLKEVLGEVVFDEAIQHDTTSDTDIKPKAPGMKYRHYAPKGSLSIVQGESDLVAEFINKEIDKYKDEEIKVGVICPKETAHLYKNATIKVVGSIFDEASIARGLYQVLRECDDEELDIIFAEGYKSDGLKDAIMNRLLKAAGHNVITCK